MVNSWLISGGCGFIGTSLIRTILDQDPNCNIRVLDNLSVGTREDLSEITAFKELSLDELAKPSEPGSVELVVGDIRDANATHLSAQGIDCIVHLAANTGVGPSVEDPRLDLESNVIGTFNMLEAARMQDVSKFILASSGAPIGELKKPPIHEELPAHPVSPYGASKLACEGYCSAYYHSYGVKTVMLRFGNVYGPRSKHKASVVAKFIKNAIAGEICEIYGDGSQTRDFIFIDDLTDAVIRSSGVDVGGEIFQIASSREVTVNELASSVERALLEYGVKMKVVNGEKRVGDVQRNFSDTSKAKRLLGWESNVELKRGVGLTAKYFLDLTR